jgi:hypothetical protein
MIWLVMTCLSGADLVTSLLLKDLSIEKEGLGRQYFMAHLHNDLVDCYYQQSNITSVA